MNTMEHRGYTARIDFDDRDMLLVGRILGIRAVISFHADNAVALRQAFEAAVNDYLDDCAARGIARDSIAMRFSNRGRFTRSRLMWGG